MLSHGHKNSSLSLFSHKNDNFNYPYRVFDFLPPSSRKKDLRAKFSKFVLPLNHAIMRIIITNFGQKGGLSRGLNGQFLKKNSKLSVSSVSVMVYI